MNLESKSMIHSIFKVSVCIAACLPVMLGGAGGLVLCLGHGGHIAIEPVHEVPHHSPDDHRDDHPGEHNLSLSHGDCTSCLDIPLSVEKADQLLVIKSASRIVELSDLAPATSALSAAARTDRDSSGLAYRLSASIPGSLEELRTTVLRT